MPTRNVEYHALPAASLANQRSIKIVRYGKSKGGKKAYIQAGLHADKAPGFLVMHHLIERLDATDSNNLINGEVVIVPVANPIGIDQWPAIDKSLLPALSMCSQISKRRRCKSKFLGRINSLYFQ